MRKVREILRLYFECKLSTRQIAQLLNMGKSTVQDYLSRARGANLQWPLDPEQSNDLLEEKLFGSAKEKSPACRKQINFHYLDQQLQKKGVTFTLVWEEYKRQHPNGYQYSRLRELYCQWKASLDLPMRQYHKAGEKCFIDYCGQTMPYRNEKGEIAQAAIFVAVLGASNMTFAYATGSQGLADWLEAHVKAFEFFGGVPDVLVPDNLKSGVTHACVFEPEINSSYLELARHYQTAVIPARVRKPKDKSKAEIGVQLVQRWICAALRDRIFISLDHLNAEISRLLEELNKKPFKKLPGSRLQRFNSLEKQALKELPSHPYEFAHWRRLRVGRDYHIGITEHFYSVPHKHAGQMVDVRFNNKTVEVFSRNERIAVHPRATTEGQTTIREHMPTNHQKYAGWNPRELCHWASEQGRHIHEIFQAIMADPERNHHQRIRCCVGLMQLSRGYDNERFEGACRHALKFQALTYRSIQSILKNRLDQQSEADAEDIPDIQHPNIRGSRYYT